MDWLILIVVVPLILVPIVLLCGFAGCGTLLSIDPDPVAATATGFVAKGVDKQRIDLSWQDSSGANTSFMVERAKIGVGFSSVNSGVNTFQDTGREEGTTFLYRLTNSGGIASGVATATTFPEAPTILEAKGIDIDSIKISWKNNSAKADSFILQHRLAFGSFVDIPVGGLTDFTHTGLTEGSAHEYRVIATVDGFDSNLPKQVQSAPSASVIASTLKWKTCYDLHPLTQNSGDILRNGCMVQRIKAAPNLLQSGGIRVRISLRAATSGDIAIARMSISQAAVPGVPLAGNPNPNEWDSAANPTPVPLVGTPAPAPLPGIPGGILLAANSTIQLAPVDYVLDNTKDLIIAFDIGNAAGTGGLASVTGCNLFLRANTAEALKADRSSGPPPANDYQKAVDAVYFVQQIDVLG